MYRPVVKGRYRHVTHRGLDEIRGFLERFVEEGLQMELEDVLVGGPPWHLRVAIRMRIIAPDPAGGDDRYNNRAAAFMEVRWGRIVRVGEFTDIERTADWGRRPESWLTVDPAVSRDELLNRLLRSPYRLRRFSNREPLLTRREVLIVRHRKTLGDGRAWGKKRLPAYGNLSQSGGGNFACRVRRSCASPASPRKCVRLRPAGRRSAFATPS
jgi:ketosteroid isomerase-like protein